MVRRKKKTVILREKMGGYRKWLLGKGSFRNSAGTRSTRHQDAASLNPAADRHLHASLNHANKGEADGSRHARVGALPRTEEVEISFF